MSIIEPIEQEVRLIGDIKIDEDERSMVKMNPKFAIQRKLRLIEQEQDTELCLAKLRYEIKKIEQWRKELEKEESEYGYGNQTKKRRIENKLSPKEEEDEVIKEAKDRQIFDPVKKSFNYSKRRTTDLKENNKVKLPDEVENSLEN